jgi:glycosyltransferase involved in cell wall biosynthesis
MDLKNAFKIFTKICIFHYLYNLIMNSPRRIAYITVSDPNDRHAWSGTNHYIWQTLKSKYEVVEALGPDEPKLVTLICKIIHGVSLLVIKKRFDYRHSTFYAKACAKLFDAKLKAHTYDLIVAPAGIAYIAYLKTTVPIVFIGDRIIANSLNYHTIISNLWHWSEVQSLKTERLALSKAKLNILSSHWAADSAITYYQLPPSKVKVWPFGANMDVLPNAEYVFKHKTDSVICKLLLVGTMWKNKGADIAVNTLKILRQRNIDAYLTIVGCEPDTPINDEHITVIPFLNKNSEKGLKQLEHLFLSHTFFILPTRFDCTPIVFCEASAYALPILSANTGGVAGHVKEGVNGYLIDYDDKGEKYAEKIISIFSDKVVLNQLTVSTRKCFDESLNWSSWVNSFDTAIKQI